MNHAPYSHSTFPSFSQPNLNCMRFALRMRVFKTNSMNKPAKQTNWRIVTRCWRSAMMNSKNTVTATAVLTQILRAPDATNVHTDTPNQLYHIHLITRKHLLPVLQSICIVTLPFQWKSLQREIGLFMYSLFKSPHLLKVWICSFKKPSYLHLHIWISFIVINYFKMKPRNASYFCISPKTISPKLSHSCSTSKALQIGVYTVPIWLIPMQWAQTLVRCKQISRRWEHCLSELILSGTWSCPKEPWIVCIPNSAVWQYDSSWWLNAKVSSWAMGSAVIHCPLLSGACILPSINVVLQGNEVSAMT